MKILNFSSFICKFLLSLNLTFSKPQRNNFLKMAEGLIFSRNTNITISNITTLFIDKPDKFALAGFFHSSTWNPEMVEEKIKINALKQAIETVKDQYKPEVIISIDDTVIEKYKDSKFELCDKVFDHAKKRYIKGVAIVTMKISFLDYAFTLFMRPYLSKNTISKLNKKYGPNLYTFKTKNEMAIEMLAEIYKIIPKNIKTFICFDSWYASNANINYCVANKSTVICSIKSNRTFDDKIIRKHFSNKKSKKWIKKRVRYNKSSCKYYTKNKCGKLKGIKKERVKIIVSRLNHKTKHPVYFLCTDDSLSVQAILDRYTKRWECEIDYYYLKTRLGLTDFRVRSALAVTRYISIVHFAIFFLQYWQMQKTIKCKRYVPLSEIINANRKKHEDKTIGAILKIISNGEERKWVKELLSV